MSYLIDTCCISEVTRPNPDPNVLSWFSGHDESEMYLSVITIGEITKGTEKLPDSGKKSQLHHWVNHDLKERFNYRIIDLTMPEIVKWGRVLANCEKAGTPMPAVDALIVATALVHDLIVVTRNVDDMRPAGVRVKNPWEG